MAIGAADISGGIKGIGDAAGSVFAGLGYQAMARGYGASADLFGKAAKLSFQNEDISRESTDIKLMQAERAIYKTIGGQQADVAGAGFAASGTALDLLRDSTTQGELTMSIVEKQGEIDANAYHLQGLGFQAQRTMALAQQDSAEYSATASFVSAGTKAIGAMAMFMGG